MSKNTIIEKYPKIFQDYNGNPGRVNWDIPKGWEHIIDWLCESLQSYTDNVLHGYDSPPQVTCSTVKEKYGQLEFYAFNSDGYQEGMIWFAQTLSRNTCIECGSMENVQMTKGYIMPLCENCYNKERIYG